MDRSHAFLFASLFGALFAAGTADAAAAKPDGSQSTSLESLIADERVCRISRAADAAGCAADGLLLYLPER